MRELLPDNIPPAERMVTLPQQSLLCSSGACPPQIVQREVASINLWTCAFATNVAILSVFHQSLVTSRIAYQGSQPVRRGGWWTYGCVLQFAADPPWIQQNLGPIAKLPCPLSHETDHQSQSCALAPLVFFPSQPCIGLPKGSLPAPEWIPDTV